MYQIKGQGKNGYLQYTPEMHSGHSMRITLENDLRRALESGRPVRAPLSAADQLQPASGRSAWKH
jgi:hypothetical protein